MSDGSADALISLDNHDVDALWEAWAPPGDEDILARAAFERTLRAMAGLEDEGLYFRPGGWVVNLPATLARAACAAAILAAVFQMAGLDDVEREIIISTATLVASMDVQPVRPDRAERRLAERLRQEGLANRPLSAERARRALPNEFRRDVSVDQVADSLDKLVDAGYADRDGSDAWVIRARGSEAWIRVRVGEPL